MDYFTSSFGILNNPQIPKLLATNSIRRLPRLFKRSFSNSDTIIGWGYKPNTLISRDVASKNNLKYLALEDGFISWLNHPVQSKPCDRLSYIVDECGIYYDASKPSGLDRCLENPTQFDDARITRLKSQLVKLGVSKYNQTREGSPEWFKKLSSNQDLKILLLVDQTYGDASIEHSGGSDKSFTHMLAWALEKLQLDPSLSLVIKTHPDVLIGKKTGYLTGALDDVSVSEFKNRIHLLGHDVSPKALISCSNEIATVSSQLGFEALWYGKKVTCFAWPFYAGRGLTQDKSITALTYPRVQVNLHQLMHAALIDYPVYLDPDTQRVCEVEVVINYLQSHFIARDLTCERLSIPNVSLWKRSFIPEFIAGSAKAVSFNAGELFKSTELIWGMKPSIAPGVLHSVMRMEDGFIRSVGLGADLRRPSSLVLDDEGIYYNGKKISRLERLLNEYELTDFELERAKRLTKNVIEASITKYNVDANSDVAKYQEKAKQREIILVTGQFQQDLSMEFGALDINDNLSLLRQVKGDYPDAYIIYKEHPDVYSGVRPGRLSSESVLKYADEYLSDTSLLSLFSITDRVCTICSLAGFEALLRGVKVSTYGLPFYAGWGLTDDRYTFDRRARVRSIDELSFISLVVYARYVNWSTRKLTTPEYVVDLISRGNRAPLNLKSNWFSRQGRKLGYLTQAVFKWSDHKVSVFK